MKKNYIVYQDGFKECGSACLLSIIRYYGGNVSLERILELTKTNKSGTTFYNISQASQEFGFIAKGYYEKDINKLSNFEKPFISQVVINNYHHFVVVYKINNNKITIMDPAKGMYTLEIDKFNKIYTGNILLLKPTRKLPIYNEYNYLVNIIKTLLLDNKSLIINLILLTLIIVTFTCIYSYHFQVIIDNVLSTNSLNLLIVSIIFLIILTIKIIVNYLRNNLLLYLNQKIDLSIITNTINKIISLPYSYYKNKTTGEVISRINDLFYIKNVISKIIITIFLDIVLAIFTFIILLKINKRMTLILLLITVMYYLIFLVYKNSVKYLTNTIQEENAKINSLLVESISSYETIKGLHIESIMKNKINKSYLKNINNNMYLSKLNNTEELLKDIFEGILLLFIIYLGTKNIMDKSLTIGALITYNSLLYYFINPIRNSFTFYQEYFYVKNSIKRINNILNYKYESLDTKSNLDINGDIVIKNLTFNYNYQNNVLNDISIVISNKSKLLILGSSGSGKSTLLKILYKYYNVSRGKVFINNYDINDYTKRDIRENITYISQNELLYTDTIRNNIILDRDISDKKFLDICNLTYVSDIISNNNLDYNYMLEENGANLSGGQKQRIVLARSLLKPSKIILIDEGLNQIDINLERKILKNIFNYYQDKTIIIVSHRHNNFDLYDKIIEINSGNIREGISKNE